MNYSTNYLRLFVSTIMIIVITLFAKENTRGVDIAPLTWTPRPEWINVKSPGIYTQEMTTPNAVGDGVADDTAAIQGVLNWVSNVSGIGPLGRRTTVYFPPGTYKITSTLTIDRSPPTSVTSCSMIGSGLNTIIKWYGPSGGAMMWPNNDSSCQFVGFVWDGNGNGTPTSPGTQGAGCAFLTYSDNGSGSSYYLTGIRHENESFRNFNVSAANYLPGHPQPVGAIVSGFTDTTGASPVGEVTIVNCRFYNSTYAIYNPVEIYNNFMWVVDGCEFDNNGTGFSGQQGACFAFINSHFQGSTVADLQNGVSVRGQRLTSSGSSQFYNGFADGIGFQDCWIDGWTNASAAVQIIDGGQASFVDCSFTNPPAGASAPIYTIQNSTPMQLLLSHNSAPAFPPGAGILNEAAGAPAIDFVPAGSMGGNVTSASQTFIKSTYPADTAHIIDVTSSTYNPMNIDPDNNTTYDWTASLQHAINDAITANNGSCVYLPIGLYRITSTLVAAGGNYMINGEGQLSQICWYGGSSSTMMTISNPQSVRLRDVHFAINENLPGWSNPNGNPICDPTTVTCIQQTGTTTSSITYDNVICDQFYWGNPAATYGNPDGPGLKLSSLPVGSTVNIPFLNGPLTAIDCGQARIFSMKANMGAVSVSGATLPKTGFLGLMVAEGGQNNPALYNFTVTDNQNLLVGPYYSEQGTNDLSLQQGSGTTPGRVAIEGFASSPTPASISINANNYLGRLFYSHQNFFGGWTSGGMIASVQVNQTGTNPISLVLPEDFFDSVAPTYSLGAGASLVQTLCADGSDGSSSSIYYVPMTDNPNPLTTANLASVAQGYDDFRQLGALNLAMEYGQINPSGLVAYWKLDETANPAADSSQSQITGTWKNSPTFSTTKAPTFPFTDAGSLALNGTNQYVSMGNPSALPTGTGARTICAWAKSNTIAAGSRVIASFGTAATGQDMYIGMNGPTLVGGGYSSDLTLEHFWDTNWHFIVLTYDGTTAKLYADGVLKKTAAKTWNLVHSACNIGAQPNTTGYWNGSVDDVRVYNRALSAAEITVLTQGGP